MHVGIATDHGGLRLKEDLLAHLKATGHDVVDFGAHSLDSGDDYPDFVIPLARAVAAGKVERGVAVCGSGVGASAVSVPAWAALLDQCRGCLSFVNPGATLLTRIPCGRLPWRALCCSC
jgi:hypothetical protein